MFDDKPTTQTFIEENTHAEISFNQQQFLTLTCEVLVHYLRYHSDYAQELIENSILYNRVTDYFSAKAIVHYSEYHWAMLLAHGHKYWQDGFNIEEPADYPSFREQVLQG